MADRELSWDRLNRILLDRQLLLRRHRLRPVQAVERLGGLQTQYAPSAYVGLWSRLAGFRREDLTAALGEARIVQAWVMRCTIHMVSAADFPSLTDAVREQRRRDFLRATPGLTDADMVGIAALVRGHLVDGPRKQSELVALITDAGHPRSAFAGVQLWLDLVRVPPAGTWDRPRAHVYGLAETWCRDTPAVDRAAAEERLVTRYLRGFGPAAAADVARYAGWTITETRQVLARLTLRGFQDPDGTELVDLPRVPLPAADTPAPVRFLSTFDAVLLLGHAARAGMVPAEHRAEVFATSKPQSAPTFLVDGRVAGTWRWSGERIETAPFETLTRSARAEVDAEAGRLAAFHLDG